MKKLRTCVGTEFLLSVVYREDFADRVMPVTGKVIKFDAESIYAAGHEV